MRNQLEKVNQCKSSQRTGLPLSMKSNVNCKCKIVERQMDNAKAIAIHLFFYLFE